MRLFVHISSLIAIVFFAGLRCEAQVVWTVPAFPTQDDLVTLYYDVAEGNGALLNVNEPCPGCPFIYAHTGVITSNSQSPSNWYHVQNPWPSLSPNNLSLANNGNTLLPIGGTVHSFDFGGMTLAEYYNLDVGEQIEQLAFVFRNADGSVVGKNADESDIFVNVSDGTFEVGFINPQLDFNVMSTGNSIVLQSISSDSAQITLKINNVIVASSLGLSLDYTLLLETPGDYLIELSGTSLLGQTSVKNISITALPVAPNTAWAPTGTLDGINYINDTTVILQIYAPYKDFIFAVGDFNSWQMNSGAIMNRTPDFQKYWIELTGLIPGNNYRFQYHILPDDVRVPDAYAEIQLDKWNDPWIPASTYPNIPEFPSEFTTNTPVSVFTPGETEFVWTDANYNRPVQENLVIYELLVRDFSEDRTFKLIEDSLDYLETLGVTAIELMPFNEFNGNDSWGYNPTFYFAPDKAYGTREDLKSLIDACHARGIAVIQDLVFNHSDQPNPFITMYWDNWIVANNNPWFNVEAPHFMNWFYDWNHNSNVTKAYVKRTLDHWIQNYHMDGFRWDFTQGFVQTPGGGSGYDAERIAIINEYGDHVWSQDPDIYMILEHWCASSEEEVLANNGFMLWANNTYGFKEAAMGYVSDFNESNYQSHGYNEPHAVTYMESHDEERLMYSNLMWGNASGDYQTNNLETALRRIELTACFHILLPGPKLIWQFEELGYDYSINTCSDGITVTEGCRIDAKPVRWDYFEVPERRRLYDVFSAINNLKKDYPVFQTTNFTFDVGGYGKRLHLSSADMNVVVVGNFKVTPIDMTPDFQHTGVWYDYLSGDSIEVSDTGASMLFNPGEYHIYIDTSIPTPSITDPTSLTEIQPIRNELKTYPNPFNDSFTLEIPDNLKNDITLNIYDSNGKVIIAKKILHSDNVISTINWKSGVYTVKLTSNANYLTTTIQKL